MVRFQNESRTHKFLNAIGPSPCSLGGRRMRGVDCITEAATEVRNGAPARAYTLASRRPRRIPRQLDRNDNPPRATALQVRSGTRPCRAGGPGAFGLRRGHGRTRPAFGPGGLDRHGGGVPRAGATRAHRDGAPDPGSNRAFARSYDVCRDPERRGLRDFGCRGRRQRVPRRARQGPTIGGPARLRFAAAPQLVQPAAWNDSLRAQRRSHRRRGRPAEPS